MEAKRPEVFHVNEDETGAEDEAFVFPLSLGQERIWFLNELAGSAPVFNLNTTVRVRSGVDLAALEEALAAVAQRHESLRTRFRLVDDRPAQLVLPDATLSLRVVDLTTAGGDRDAAARAILFDDARRPFDLAQDELIRTTFVKTSADEALLSVTMHHIVSDGWSIGIFFSELSALWSGFATGRLPRLAELPIQYGDFAVWERERLASGALDGQIAFWKRKLAGAPTLDLPPDRVRPQVQTFGGATVPLEVEPAMKADVVALGRLHGATPFMTLFAAFVVLLHRLTGEDDLVVGSYVAGRGRAELEQLIGFFLNTLPVRVDVSGDPTFADLLVRVREMLVEAFEHQDVPFARLVEELRPERDLSRSPLCQLVFQMINVPTLDETDERREALVDLGQTSSAFDLTCTLWDSGGGWRGHIEYCTDLFEPVTVERLAARFRAVLAAVVGDPDVPVSKLNVLPPAERRLLVETWSGTARPYPETPLAELFAAAAARTPARPAFLCGADAISYAELDRRSGQLAHRLVRMGARPETVVAICLERSLDACVAVLAVVKTGAAYLALDPAYPPARLSFMLSDSSPVALVTRTGAVEGIDARNDRVVRLDADAVELAATSVAPLPAVGGLDSLAYVIYTSGSTGHPKGVAVEQRQIVNRLAWMWETYPFEPGEVACQKTALSFVDSIWELFGGLLQNVPTVVIRDEVLRDAAALVDELARTHVTRIWVVPSFLRALLGSGDRGGESLRALRFWVTSGEPLSAELEQRFRLAFPHATLYNLYGTSEVWDATWFDPELEQGPYVRPPIGRPIANVRTYVLDRHGEPMPIGAYGELHVGGAGVARGYIGEAPDVRFLRDPFASSEAARLYATGDSARYLWDGTLELVGRSDDQLKIRGYRVEPAEVEAALIEHPAIRDAVVVGRTEREDVSLVAYLVSANGEAVDLERVRADIHERLPDHMIPGAFAVLDAIPHTPSGKRDRRRLARIAPRPVRTRTDEKPIGEIERILSGIWKDLLGLEAVGRRDNFFDLGGHSLMMFQLQGRIAQTLGVRLAITELFYHPTIQALAVCLAQHVEPAAAPVGGQTT
jgi:amino acid adenylation domain-containing protein